MNHIESYCHGTNRTCGNGQDSLVARSSHMQGVVSMTPGNSENLPVPPIGLHGSDNGDNPGHLITSVEVNERCFKSTWQLCTKKRVVVFMTKK